MAYYIKNYMEKDVFTLAGEATVREAAKAMSEKECDYLIVLKEGKPVGIVTERDFIVKVLTRDVNPSTVKIYDIMSTPLITVDPDEDMLKAASIMQEHKIRKLPVVREGIMYGIITADDIAAKCGAYVDRTVRDIAVWAPFLSL